MAEELGDPRQRRAGVDQLGRPAVPKVVRGEVSRELRAELRAEHFGCRTLDRLVEPMVAEEETAPRGRDAIERFLRGLREWHGPPETRLVAGVVEDEHAASRPVVLRDPELSERRGPETRLPRNEVAGAKRPPPSVQRLRELGKRGDDGEGLLLGDVDRNGSLGPRPNAGRLFRHRIEDGDFVDCRLVLRPAEKAAKKRELFQERFSKHLPEPGAHVVVDALARHVIEARKKGGVMHRVRLERLARRLVVDARVVGDPLGEQLVERPPRGERRPPRRYLFSPATG